MKINSIPEPYIARTQPAFVVLKATQRHQFNTIHPVLGELEANIEMHLIKGSSFHMSADHAFSNQTKGF
jgi:hypothetical protein